MRISQLIVLAVLAAVLAACTGPAARATASPIVTPFQPTSSPIPDLRQLNLQANAQGIQMEASNIRHNGVNLLEMDLCYDLPEGEAWMPGTTVELRRGDWSLPLHSLSLIELIEDENGRAIRRCDTLGFLLEASASLEGLSLYIPRLESSLGEHYDCELANSKLAAQELGIQVACESGEGYSGFDVVEKPEEMALEEAQRLASDAFTEIIAGPWHLQPSTP